VFLNQDGRSILLAFKREFDQWLLQTKEKDSDRKNYVINEAVICFMCEKVLDRAFKILNTTEKLKIIT
jgi:hypothetical protein